jgi:hypothetical protein
MSSRARPSKPMFKPAPKPRHRRERAAQPIPRPERPVQHPEGWDWAPEVELVVGVPRADRKAKGPGNA